jgi:hypothetical protein
MHVRHCIYLPGGFSLQTPQFSDHPYQWATFLPGKRGLHFDINPAVLAPHKLSLPLSHVSSSCSHAAKSNAPPRSAQSQDLFGLQVEGVFLTCNLNSCFRKNVSITVNLSHIAPIYDMTSLSNLRNSWG